MSNSDRRIPPGQPDADVTRPPSEPDGVSRTIGLYLLLQKIGDGGMGEVWLAEQTQPVRRQVALKVIKAGMDTAQVVARFQAERQALALMDHPNIAKVFDGGSTPETRPFFVMEYVRGEPITDYCDRVKMPLRERLELFATLCEGVQHAHQKGIIHRDLKPSNVLVSLVADRPVPRIIDFGIAKATARPLTDTPMHTELGGFIGTPEYMSPEQADGALDVDTRSDVYSLGIILYELITGKLPFDSGQLRSGSAEEMRRTIREKDPPRPSTRLRDSAETRTSAAAQRATSSSRLVASLRGELDWITLKALEKDRTRRYPTANALALDIRRYLQNEAVSAGPPGAAYRASKFVRRNLVAVSATAAAFVALLLFVGALAVQTLRLAEERDRSAQEAGTAAQVTEFLINLFNVSDPSEARGNTLTAREVLDRGARQLEAGLEDQPHLRLRLQTAVGTVYTNLGLYEAAGPLLQRAVETSRERLGGEHPDTIAAMNALAALCFYQRDYSRSAELYTSVLAARQARLGAEHRETLKARFDLASAYLGLHKFDEVEKLVLPTLAMQRTTLGHEHPDTLASLNNLQNLFFQQKRFREALPIAEEVFNARVKIIGLDHPQTLTAMHNVASIHHELGNLARAEELQKDALNRSRRVLGPRHASTLRRWRRYAEILAATHRTEDAVRELRAILEQIGDDTSPPYPALRVETLTAMSSLIHEQ